MLRELVFYVLIPVHGCLKAPLVQREFQLQQLQERGGDHLFSEDSKFC